MNNFAISTSGIAEALQRSGGALAAANNSLDESIALAVGMNNVVQDPAKTGTSLKTLSMYLRAAKTEAEESGESTEGMAESVSKLRSEILALTGNRVDVMLNNDTFKSTTQIIRELADVWDELSDVSQANILERIGGKRNGSAIASLITNFDDVEAALKTSQTASGSALKENEKYLNSIQGHLDVLKATGQSLSVSFLKSNFVTGIMDVVNGLGKGLDALVKNIGLLPTLLGGGGIAAFFKNLD